MILSHLALFSFLADINVNMDVNKIVNTLGSQLQQYGPGVWNTAMTLRHWEAIGWVLAGFAFLTIGIVLACVVRYFLTKVGSDGDDGIYMFAVMLSGTASILMLAVSASYLLNVWTWIGVFQPGLSLAHDVLLRVLSQ